MDPGDHDAVDLQREPAADTQLIGDDDPGIGEVEDPGANALPMLIALILSAGCAGQRQGEGGERDDREGVFHARDCSANRPRRLSPVVGRHILTELAIGRPFDAQRVEDERRVLPTAWMRGDRPE